MQNPIKNEEELRRLYPPPIERARLKVLARLDKHCRNFIARSPFLCLGTFSPHGADVTPRGDEPGLVHVLEDTTLAIPDWPGNNRLDSSANIVLNPQIALLFFIPGVQETLRVNGAAAITDAAELLNRWDRSGKHPRAILVVTVHEA